MRLSIRHETRYEYERPVSFAPHRLLVRPRDSHALRLLSASLELSPLGETRWMYDALGNCVCTLTPRGAATSLRIVNHLTLERYPAALTPQIDDPHSAFPIVYDASDRLVLGPLMAPATDDHDADVLTWLRGYIGHPSEPALFLIERLNSAIHRDFAYGERLHEGVQTPAETLLRRAGTCRDFAWLLVEALRRLGFAARFVTGYIYCPGGQGQLRGAGATHAWCEAFLPRLGWTEFDPTNGLAESPDLIAVAVARTPAQAAPVTGAVIGDPGTAELHVAVSVHLLQEEEAQAVAA